MPPPALSAAYTRLRIAASILRRFARQIRLNHIPSLNQVDGAIQELRNAEHPLRQTRQGAALARVQRAILLLEGVRASSLSMSGVGLIAPAPFAAFGMPRSGVGPATARMSQGVTMRLPSGAGGPMSRAARQAGPQLMHAIQLIDAARSLVGRALRQGTSGLGMEKAPGDDERTRRSRGRRKQRGWVGMEKTPGGDDERTRRRRRSWVGMEKAPGGDDERAALRWRRRQRARSGMGAFGQRGGGGGGVFADIEASVTRATNNMASTAIDAAALGTAVFLQIGRGAHPGETAALAAVGSVVPKLALVYALVSMFLGKSLGRAAADTYQERRALR
jgi:hypothetical protein